MSVMLGASTRCCRPDSRAQEISFTFCGGRSPMLVTATVSAAVEAIALGMSSTDPMMGTAVPWIVTPGLSDGTQAPTTLYPAPRLRVRSRAICATEP